ncbi:hypothetical protein FG609_023240 [Salmonella enterica subsp. enterica serovar Typhimurium]|uniref:hypothetical protein n=1 Tax=Salmonella enterica TaxID=28901 RepID=UPI001123F3AF|nr:hypothetical protein [Salmonella enterica]EDG6829056.1 hypothetical protein [Salmonella enterica subsp. enterica serovar Typhimurium]EDG8239200.1 hypothetical protein [Salmonella enterica subsp. enterica serovar Typhimurium]EDG8244263.1 hypothetical protein [Salmonella enterica subsp. enterica serovar Typhimurium]EDH0633954.1 hypothetical protein [Salmonella enterica subsp. enterica serovar Typhimurium]EEO3023001.1 hypothetical protein [Salmonella enterica]
MSEMILDSLFLITVANINKNGNLPEYVDISRHGFKRRYQIGKVLEIACLVTNMRRPVDGCSVKHAQMILGRAISEVRRKRRRAPYRFYPNSTKQVVGEGEGVVDLREASCNVGGIARDWLMSIISKHPRAPTPQEGQAVLALMRKTHLVITDTPNQAARMQHYLACRGFTTLAVPSEYATDIKLPPVPEWSEPKVDHQ